jgi:CBS domain-containing protein
MLCRDIMKRNVHCLEEQTSAQEAAQKMRDYNVGFLPVCAANSKPIGTVTDRDLAVRVCGHNLQAADVKVCDIMTDSVVWVRADDDLKTAERQMAQNHISRILVCDQDGNLAGVISLSDIVQREEPMAALNTFREVVLREVQAA